MASRMLHGSRPHKPKGTADEKDAKPSGLPKRPSVSSPPPGTSRIPIHSTSSFFSRGRSRPDEGKPPVLSKQRLPTTPKPPEAASSRPEPRNAPSAAPRGLAPGMGTRTEISAATPLPPRNRLRRKASSMDQRGIYARSEPSLSPGGHAPGSAARPDPFPASLWGVALPAVPPAAARSTSAKPAPTELATSSSRMAHYMSRQPPPPPHRSAEDLSPPTPGFARSSSASTRRSESPGPFSRTSTPTSASSYSPAVLQAPKAGARPTALSPTRSRPPVTRRKMSGPDHEERTGRLGLSAVRESLASTSSSSTVKTADPIDPPDVARAMPNARPAPPPPTPPLRLSSRRGPPPRTAIPSEPKDGGAKPAARSRSTPAPSRLPHPAPTVPAASGRPKVAPPRPSRAGAAVLETRQPSPIIQSNLSRLAVAGHVRRASTEAAAPPASSSGRSGSRPAKLQSRLRSPSSTSVSSAKSSAGPPSAPAAVGDHHPFPRDSDRSSDSLPLQTEALRAAGGRAASPATASPARSATRFGLFPRRTGAASETGPVGPAERPANKGPAAGTGYEGYGRYSRRGRSSSVSTTASRAASASAERPSAGIRPASGRKSSFGSDAQPELDEFYRHRLEPVVIGGGGTIRENRNSGSGCNGGSGWDRIGGAAATRSSLDSSRLVASAGRPHAGSALGPGGGAAPSKRASTGLLPPSRIAARRDVGPASDRSTLAERRLLHRSQLFGEAEPVKIPDPINTRVLAPSPMLDSYDTAPSSVPGTAAAAPLADDASEGHGGSWPKPKKRPRVRLPTKWSFFQRTPASPRHAVFAHAEIADSSGQLPASISRLPEPRSVAYYAMLDGSEQSEPEDMEDILRGIEESLALRRLGPGRDSASAPEPSTGERARSMLLPSPPLFPTAFDEPPRSYPPRVPLHNPHVAPDPAVPSPGPAGKESRLPQIGRIPKVVSKRDRPHRASPQSFSRPFARRDRPGSDPPAFGSLPEPPIPADPHASAVQIHPPPSAPCAAALGDDFPRSAPPPGAMPLACHEFLAFSPRIGSDVSGDSSSGAWSLLAMTAAMPAPGAARSDDEVWNEYDELLDRVASPLGLPTAQDTERLLHSFPSLSQLLGSSGGRRERTSVGAADGFPAVALAESPPSPPPQQPLPLPPRRAEAARQAARDEPLAPLLSDVYAGCGNRSSTARSSRQSTVSGSRYSSQTVLSNSDSRHSCDGERIRRSLQAMAEKTNGSLDAPDSLRFGALMASRWLSFDRVLFSPAAEELSVNRQDRVLVLDGLGNDDWSSYCALAYPTTTVYHLTTSLPSAASGDADWQRPLNHCNIPLPSVTHPFPFPKGFFTAVVLRFPSAASAAITQHIVAECKRVLRPGGYLELFILDMDMVNMGNRARRAIRGLKLRIQTATPEVSLSPASDTIEKLLGRRGFENLSRCTVGVPVAGNVAGSPAGSLDESGDGGGSGFRDLLREEAALGGDVPMAKVVARVGRWWWSRCYERRVLAQGDADGSIWADQALLRECQKRGTGFRLVVCYAQKPVNARRRTVSV